MDVLEAIKSRREITNFKDEPISLDVLEVVLDAAYLSPAGNNLPSREFILVTDPDVLKELANATPFVPWLATSKAAIIVTGRPDVSKYWLQDASIASGYIWLAAVEQGLGAAFGAIYHSEDQVESEKRETHVIKQLSLPDDRRIVSILGLGYPAILPDAKKLLPRESIVFYGTIK
ncbi:nitroreductase family protein [Ferdinandcohnia quinoae]|uniref:Nitroreductase family protein n=1 Tax=Fredinandcohnia quinoae TaxID=2918902 RepID=A0AAW5DTK8_9BACI|nr:nitroreductase family protein [Fredinandcohnia sp. SECRCQ15]MCH1623985.1 nitroreductase family protein [Fredinandcohnia sp. SECRCQ15]